MKPRRNEEAQAHVGLSSHRVGGGTHQFLMRGGSLSLINKFENAKAVPIYGLTFAQGYVPQICMMKGEF
jgi:hypothetical protein